MRGEYRVAQHVERELLEGREIGIVGRLHVTWTAGRDRNAARVVSSTFAKLGIRGGYARHMLSRPRSTLIPRSSSLHAPSLSLSHTNAHGTNHNTLSRRLYISLKSSRTLPARVILSSSSQNENWKPPSPNADGGFGFASGSPPPPLDHADSKLTSTG